MGRTGKATTTTIKAQPEKDTKECVSEDTISKLMKDFTCASLLTNISQSATKDQKSSLKEAHAECCEEIVSSLKDFHLKTPANKRTRLKVKKNQQRKAKTILENKFNLSVAAIHSQTSVLWPGKLNLVSNKTCCSSSDVILRPSRLHISGIIDKPLCPSSLSSPIQTSSSEEKARIAATLSDQNLSSFGDIKEKECRADLSFSDLCNRNSKDSASVLSSSPLSATSVKTQTYRNCQKANKHTSGFYEETCKENTDIHTPSQPQQRTLPQSHCFNLSLSSSNPVEADLMNNNSVPNLVGYPLPLTVSQSSSVNSSSSSSITPERSCSEEMRMEESNVNELASYFEDLLHIPRKMSVMAEMMYA